MSQSSGTSQNLRCRCRRPAIMATTWKGDNVGRRFWGCGKYPNPGYCDFFQWRDTPICDRARQIIPGLLNKMNELREENRKLEMLSEKLDEMARILQDANGRMEKQNRELKKENHLLKLQMKEKANKKFTSIMKLMAISFVLVFFLWFIELVYGCSR
ncbi:hypothetical protein ACS0TY_017853 [Phlomoides rotata]